MKINTGLVDWGRELFSKSLQVYKFAKLALTISLGVTTTSVGNRGKQHKDRNTNFLENWIQAGFVYFLLIHLLNQ